MVAGIIQLGDIYKISGIPLFSIRETAILICHSAI